jgi:phosphoenolpyruvate carboxykinase (ATP)
MTIPINTPSKQKTQGITSTYGLDNIGISDPECVYWNLSTEALYEESISRREVRIASMGPIVANTGKHTARSVNDKVIVREKTTEDTIWWGQHNRPYTPDKFDGLIDRMLKFFKGRDIFVQDCYVGADPDYRTPIRIVTEFAWHSHFARNMFILPKTEAQYRNHIPQFTVICAPSFKASPQLDATTSETFIVLNFERKLCIIGGTAYAGEIKKSIFTVLNYLLPLKGVLSMHCSANIGRSNDTAIFFGLSGTGKTTLSADPQRSLIGDDEHGWNDHGIFNFEGGCYAKVIRLSPTAEPQIYATTRRFGTILENVPLDPITRTIDLDDESITENTRASYPLDFIENAIPDKKGGHPKNIILLTCDVLGVMPPIARLTPDQTLYQFISGYTSRIAGTEVGLGKEPQLVFSTCFGAPFMVHHPYVYADLLKKKILQHGATCWLVNTGWIGGAYGTGKRISIEYTRRLLNDALNGTLNDVRYTTDPVFGFQIPESCDGVPTGLLNPADSWPDQNAYMDTYRLVARKFIENFKKYESECPPEVKEAGPKI